MGWTVHKDKSFPGKFAYELWAGFETIHTVGGFDTLQQADKAAGKANTKWLLYGITDPEQSLDDLIEKLTDDELLAELLKPDLKQPLRDRA